MIIATTAITLNECSTEKMSSSAPFIPIVEDVESTRVRLPLSSVTPTSRELVQMNRTAYLYLPRITKSWQQQWHAYRKMRENVSLPRTPPCDYPIAEELDSKKLSACVENHATSQLPSLEKERAASSLSDISHDCCVALLSATEKIVTNSGRWEEEKGLSPAAFQTSRKKNTREEDQIVNGKGSQDFRKESSPTKEGIANAVDAPASSTCSFFTPHLLKEWWASSLSMWFLPQQDSYSLPSSGMTPVTSSKTEKEVQQEHVSLASAESMPHPAFLHTTDLSPSILARQQRKERVVGYLRQRYFSFSYPNSDSSAVGIPPAERRDDLSSSCRPWPSTSYHACTLWEDRRREIDDFTLSISSLPFFRPVCEEDKCSPSSSLTSSTVVMGTKEAKKNTFACRVLYPEDVTRMDPFAFRSRANILWDLAEAISHSSTDGPPMTTARGDSDTQWMPVTDFSSVPPTGVMEVSSSPSANGVSILLSYLYQGDGSTASLPSADAISPRVRKHSGLQVAGLLRCRVLVELCVLRLSGTKIFSRCPFQWRTAAHFFFSLANATSSACMSSHFFTSKKTKKEQKMEDDVEDNSLKTSSVSLLLLHMGAYVHHAIIPYLSMKDRQLWNRPGKDEVSLMTRNKKDETIIPSSLSYSTEPSRETRDASPPPLLVYPLPQAAEHTTRASENHTIFCSTSPIPFPVAHFPLGFLKESVRTCFPSSLQSAVTALLASSASQPTEVFEYETKEKEKEEDEPFLPEVEAKNICSAKKDVEQKEKIASFLVELLFFQCGWVGDTIIHEDVGVGKTINEEKKEFFEMFAISREYLEHGISLVSGGKLESILPSPAVEKKTVNHDGGKHTSKGPIFLLRDVLRSQEEHVRKDLVGEGNFTPDSVLSSESDAFSAAVRGTNVFHSSFARRTALKEFFIKYFLSDPKSAFDKNQSC